MSGRKMMRRLVEVASDPGECTGVRELAEWALRAEGDGADLAELEEAIVDLTDRIDAEMVELPMDMDGEPIHLGDKIFDLNGDEHTASSLYLLRCKDPTWMVNVGFGAHVSPRDLTHKPKDSLERIAEEIEKSDVEGCIDWADRIRKLAKEREHE